MILARDGDDGLLDQHEAWARETFARALAGGDDRVAEMRDGLRHNPAAIATLGLIHLLHRQSRPEDRDQLIRIAGNERSRCASGFEAGAAALHAIDPRIVPAILRCALGAQVRPRRSWRRPEEEQEKDEATFRDCVDRAVRSEIAWLDRDGPEPPWPRFPDRQPPMQRSIRLNGDEPVRPSSRPSSDILLTDSAARWVKAMTLGPAAVDAPWIEDLVESYVPWTASANGAGLDEAVDRDPDMDSWNAVHCALLARVAERMEPGRAAFHIGCLIGVPDEPFFDLAVELVRSIDQEHFGDHRLGADLAVRLRSLIADRLKLTNAWWYERDRTDTSFGRSSGAAIASLFFNNFGFTRGAECYLLGAGIDRIDPFLPELSRLIADGPVPFTAILSMNLLEVSPRPAHLTFLLSSAKVWLERQPGNVPLWVDYELGARVARWIEAVVGVDPALRLPSHPLRPTIDEVLARLVSVGVAEAHRVERLIASETEPSGRG